MARRRASGEGSLYFSKALNTWVAEIILPDGKKKRKKNKRQSVVREWLDEQKENLKKGIWASKKDILYGDFLDRYMGEIVEHYVRPKTFESRTYMVNRRIKPAFGGKKIAAIRPDHIQYFYSELLKEGLSKATVRYIHNIVNGMCKFRQTRA